MFFKAINHNVAIVTASILVFLSVLCFYFSIDGMMKIVIDKTTNFFPFLSFAISGYSGYGISRLNVFDKMDELQERDAAFINDQAATFRSSFENILSFTLCCGAIIFILGLIASTKPIFHILYITIDFKIVIGVFVSFVLATNFMLLSVMLKIFNHISELRNKVIQLGLTEKKRKALLEKMNKQAEKYPLSEMDFHFKKHKNTINS